MKAIFFGGAFNPVTKAHLSLAEYAKNSLGFDVVLFVPTKSKYILSTENKDFSFTQNQRFQMLKILEKNHPFIKVSDIELNKERQPRTYETLKELKREGYELKLMIGSDWLEGLKNKWKHVEEICKEFGLIVLSRHQDDVEDIIDNDDFFKPLKQYITILKTPNDYKEISSSNVRKLLENKNIDKNRLEEMVPHELVNYIIGRHNHMKDNMMKVSCLIPDLKISDVRANLRSIKDLYLSNSDSTIMVTPELSLTGYTCQDLFFQDNLLNEVLLAIEDLKLETKDKNNLLVVGAPIKKDNSLYNCAVYLHNGKILGIVPKSYIPNYAEFYEDRWFASGKDIKNETIRIFDEDIPFGIDLLLRDINSNAVIATEICEDLWVPEKPSTKAALNGANIILNLSASDENIQKSSYRRDLVKMQSSSLYCDYIYCSSTYNESSQDLVFSGHNIIAENGSLLNEVIYPDYPSSISAIIDTSKAEYNRIHQSTFETRNDGYRTISISLKSFLDKDIEVEDKAKHLIEENYRVTRFPFVPSDDSERKQRCLEILTIQAHGLATRVRNTGIKKLIIGISGGLDSTLALLVACEAKKIVPDIKIIGITMPSVGMTTSLTKENALSLMKLLDIETREIPIRETVEMHLKDIGHSLSYEGEKDTAYENAQARYRTYILMDIANMEGGLVVGTGDLSELALGWCTYNGDHMSMYGVNSSVPKTLVQYIVKTYASEISTSVELTKTLLSIVDTPISPELTPNSNDKIAQKTEDRIGKYDLNDFFLYHFMRYGFSPRKIMTLALVAYKELDKNSIKESLKRFYLRFYSQQFKRSCLPDGVKVGSITLSPRGDYRMPSDASCKTLLDELEEC